MRSPGGRWRCVAGTKEGGLVKDGIREGVQGQRRSRCWFWECKLESDCLLPISACSVPYREIPFSSPGMSVLVIPSSFWFSYKRNHLPVLSMNWLLLACRKESYYFCQLDPFIYSGDSKVPLVYLVPIGCLVYFIFLVPLSLLCSLFSSPSLFLGPNLPYPAPFPGSSLLPPLTAAFHLVFLRILFVHRAAFPAPKWKYFLGLSCSLELWCQWVS